MSRYDVPRGGAVPVLVAPTTELYAPWQAAHAEWGPGLHEDGFGLGPDDDPTTVAGFRAWVERLHRAPAQSWWIVEAAAVVGAIALRPQGSEAADRLGHVGYGIRPTARGRGLATWALGKVLAVARAQGRHEVLVMCEVGNRASAAVVERHGGVVLPGVDMAVHRYRVPLD